MTEMFAVYGITEDETLSGCTIFRTKKDAYNYIRSVFSDVIWSSFEEKIKEMEITEEKIDAILEFGKSIGYTEFKVTDNYMFGNMNFVIEPVYLPV